MGPRPFPAQRVLLDVAVRQIHSRPRFSTPTPGQEIARAPAGHEAHFTVYTSAESRLSAAVTLGAKLANRLGALVAAGADHNGAADVVTATLTPPAAADS